MLVPSEMRSTAVGGLVPSALRSRCPSCAESAIASPSAVPSPGRRAASAARTSDRSAVGGTATTARDANETTPTRNFSGTLRRKAFAAVAGGPEPRRLDVLRGHRARDVDRQDHGRLLTRDADVRVRARDSDHHRGQRHQEDRDRKMAAPSRCPVDEVGKQGEVREAGHVRATAALVSHVRHNKEGHDQEPEEREW